MPAAEKTLGWDWSLAAHNLGFGVRAAYKPLLILWPGEPGHAGLVK